MRYIVAVSAGVPFVNSTFRTGHVDYANELDDESASLRVACLDVFFKLTSSAWHVGIKAEER